MLIKNERFFINFFYELIIISIYVLVCMRYIVCGFFFFVYSIIFFLVYFYDRCFLIECVVMENEIILFLNWYMNNLRIVKLFIYVFYK